MTDRQINIKGNDIYIVNGESLHNIEVNHVFEFNEPRPTIRVFEDNRIKRAYLIETLESNPDLTGQYFHSSVRVLKNSAVMIDGIISKEKGSYSTEKDYEGIRLQPFMLTDRESENEKIKGKGLFQRGLHFSGSITPTNVRVICICDNCLKSFSLQHFHAGFSEAQYFYSSDSKQTLVVNYYEIKELPTQLQKDINATTLATIEQQLPKPTIGSGTYKYYNSFRCPYCGTAFIDFEKNKDIRPAEYYGNYLVNNKPQRLDKK